MVSDQAPPQQGQHQETQADKEAAFAEITESSKGLIPRPSKALNLHDEPDVQRAAELEEFTNNAITLFSDHRVHGHFYRPQNAPASQNNENVPTASLNYTNNPQPTNPTDIKYEYRVRRNKGIIRVDHIPIAGQVAQDPVTGAPLQLYREERVKREGHVAMEALAKIGDGVGLNFSDLEKDLPGEVVRTTKTRIDDKGILHYNTNYVDWKLRAKRSWMAAPGQGQRQGQIEHGDMEGLEELSETYNEMDEPDF